MKTFRLLVACTAICGLFFAVQCSDGGGGSSTETDCTDGQDNDGDGATDCFDSDCSGHPNCSSSCNNNSLCEPALGENSTNCPGDCPANPVCGNNICETGEDDQNCPADCGTTCNNNGLCEPALGENNANCAADCPNSSSCTTNADLLAQNGCPGENCSLTDAQGTIGCIPSGTNADYADCSNQAGCLPGAICAGPTGGTEVSCQPFCDLASPSCPGGGVCIYQIATSDPAGNIGLCGQPDSCDPFAQTGCGGGEACYLLSDGSTLCATAGTGAAGATCQYLDDCAGGLVCAGSPATCHEICDAAFTCTTGTCQGIGTIPNWPALGICQ